MNRNERRRHQGWALVVLGATVLVLAACGRKGPLDLPPAASSQPPVAAVQGDQASDQTSKPNIFNSGYGADGLPATPKGAKKPFVLDPLLNSN